MKNKPELYESAAISELMESIDPQELKKVEKRMQLAAKIANGMKAKGLNKKGLMDAMGQNNQSVVTKWLSGTHNFNMETLMDLEHVLNIRLLDVEPKRDVVSILHATVQSQPVAYAPENMASWIKNSTGLSIASEQSSYYGKPVEA